MAVLSCLPESTGPGGTGSAKPASPPPAHHDHPRRPGSEDEEERPPPREPEPPEVAAPGTCPAPRPHWEEVRADGIYVLNVDDEGSGGAAEEVKAGGSGDGWTAAPCAELFPWPPVLGAGGAEAPRVPAAGDTPRSPERRRRRGWQPVCAGDNMTADSGSGEGANGGRVGDGDGRGKQTTGARLGPESSSIGIGQGEGGTREGQLATPEEATRVVEDAIEEEKVTLNGGLGREVAGHFIRPAAAGLLARLRDSIHRRVRTVPYSTTTPTPPPGDSMHRRRRRRRESGDGDGSGTARSTTLDSQDGHEEEEGEEAAQPEAEGGGGSRAAAVGRQRGGDSALKDAAATAAPAADTEISEGSQGVGAPEGTASRAAPVVASRVGVLFSGGLDSVVLAAMLAEEGGGRRPAVPKGEAIDLINVCFDRYEGTRVIAQYSATHDCERS